MYQAALRALGVNQWTDWTEVPPAGSYTPEGIARPFLRCYAVSLNSGREN